MKAVIPLIRNVNVQLKRNHKAPVNMWLLSFLFYKSSAFRAIYK